MFFETAVCFCAFSCASPIYQIPKLKGSPHQIKNANILVDNILFQSLSSTSIITNVIIIIMVGLIQFTPRWINRYSRLALNFLCLIRLENHHHCVFNTFLIVNTVPNQEPISNFWTKISFFHSRASEPQK